MKTKDPYTPINCHFYDHFEAAIVQNRPVTLEFQDEEQKLHKRVTKLKDLQTINKEEFLILEDKTVIRLDKILSINGRTAPDPAQHPINCIN